MENTGIADLYELEPNEGLEDMQPEVSNGMSG